MISGILSEGLCFPAAASWCTARAMTSASVPTSRCMNSGRMLSLLSLTAASCFCSVRSAAAMFLQTQARMTQRNARSVLKCYMTLSSIPSALYSVTDQMTLDL